MGMHVCMSVLALITGSRYISMIMCILCKTTKIIYIYCEYMVHVRYHEQKYCYMKISNKNFANEISANYGIGNTVFAYIHWTMHS